MYKRSYIKALVARSLNLRGEVRDKFSYIGGQLPSQSIRGQHPQRSTTDPADGENKLQSD